MTSIPVLLEKMCLGALGPLDGTDNDDLVVQILKGQASIAKQKVFSIRRALLRIFRGYALRQQLILACRVSVTHTQRLKEHGSRVCSLLYKQSVGLSPREQKY